jgi:hypothetical protein
LFVVGCLLGEAVADVDGRKSPSDSPEDQHAQPLPGAPLSTKYGRQSTEGGARGGRLSVDGACKQEPDGDTRRRDSDLDSFGPSDRRNTLRHVSLVYCIEMYTD